MLWEGGTVLLARIGALLRLLRGRRVMGCSMIIVVVRAQFLTEENPI
jgi:hypothetical protein